MERIRVCQMITELRPAGAERCVYELAKRLDRSRFDVLVVALRGGQVQQMLADAGVRVHVLGVRGKWDLVRFGTLVDVLRRERINIVHTHLFHADLAGRPAARLAAVPRLVHTVHVADPRLRPWRFAYARVMAGYCDRIVCVSRAVLEHHRRRSGLPAERYTVIHNGIAVEEYFRDDQARGRLRAQWGVAEDRVLVAYVGRLDRQKGLDTLVSAMAHLAARGHPMELVIAGEGPQRRLVENFVAHGEGGARARFLGFTSDVRGVLSAADVLVMPSRWEGFGLVAAEAMAAGLPIIATRVPALMEVLEDGRTAILTDREDSVGLSEALERLAADAQLRKQLGQAAHEDVVARFRIEDTIAAHEKLYSEIAG
jgi:glycosyltransferase involved in cell wall biosynthesis